MSQRSSVGGVLLLVAFLAFLVLVGICGGFRWLAMRARTEVAPAPTAAETAAERDLDIRQAFPDEPAGPLRTDPPPEFQALLDDLGRCLRNGGADGGRFWDVARLVSEFNRDGALTKLSASDRRGTVSAFDRTLPKMTENLALTAGYDTAVIRGFRWLIPDQEAVVVVRHFSALPDGTEVPFKMRWWLVKTPNGWKLYDFEDLAFGSRMTVVMSTTFQTLIPGGRFDAAKQRRMSAAVPLFRQALPKLMAGEFAEALADLDRIDLPALPPEIQTILHCFRGIALVRLERPDDSLKALAEAERLAGRPLPQVHVGRADAMFLKKDFRACVTEARKAVEMIGPDSDTSLLIGQSLRELGEVEEARKELRRGSDDTPNDLDLIDALRQALPADGKKEVGERLMKTKDPARNFPLLHEAAAGDLPGSDAYTEAFVAKFPKDANGQSEMVGLLLRKKDVPGAAKALSATLAHGADKDREDRLAGLVRAFVEAESELAAYKAVPAMLQGVAFRELAMMLTGDDEDGEEIVLDKGARRLAALLEARAADEKDDAWLPYYRGWVAVANNDRLAAEKHYSEGMKRKLEPFPAMRYRTDRVRNLFEAGKGLDAYRDVPPASDTFRQLASLAREDAAFLKRLLAEHAKADPKDPWIDYFSGRLAHDAGEDAEAVKRLGAFRAAIFEDKDNAYWGFLAGNLMVRSLARQKKFSEAYRLLDAEDGKGRPDDQLLPVLVAILEGDQATAMRKLDLLDAGREWLLRRMYADKDIAPLLKGEKFKALREKYPEPKAAKE